MELKKVRVSNGVFAECPNCHKLMAHNAWDGSWWCITGCGLKVNEKRGTTDGNGGNITKTSTTRAL